VHPWQLMSMKKFYQLSLIVCFLSAVILLMGVALHYEQWYKPAAITTAITLAIGLGSIEALKGYQYTAWIIVAVTAGMLFPQLFKTWGTVNLRDKTLILVIIQLVMFGMGTHMSLKDFNNLR